MKYRIFLWVTLLTAAATFAQNSIEKNIPQFNEIKVFDLIDVEMIKAEKNQVIITGFNIDAVKIITDDGVLKIRMELDTRFNGNDTNVKVYYTQVDVIDANEGSKITVANPLQQESITIKCQEGGKVHAALNTHVATFKSVTGGSIHVSGSTTFQDIVVNSGGTFMAETLISENTQVNVTAGGTAAVRATASIDATVTAGGTINVYGKPEKIKKKKRLGGKIKIIK